MQLHVELLSNISHSSTCSKTWGNGPKRQKNPQNSPFFLSLSTLPCHLRSPKKTKSTEHKTMKHTLLIFIKYSMICIVFKCQQSCMSTSIIKRKKTLGQATTSDAFTTSCNSNIKHTFTYSKNLGKNPNG